MAALKAATPVPGPTKIRGRSPGNFMVPFIHQMGTVVWPGVAVASHPEQTPEIWRFSFVSYFTTAIVISHDFPLAADEMLNSRGF